MIDADVVIVGGGVAGLWTLSELKRQGLKALLVENGQLGQGQTISAQGIIHGGLKYSLKGVLTASADEIREMPGVWRSCLSGQSQPDLSPVAIRSHYCYLWQTESLSSLAGMLAAQLSLRVKPVELSPAGRPDLLKETSGAVYRLDEQIISPGSLLSHFRETYEDYILSVDAEEGVEFCRNEAGAVKSVLIRKAGREQTIDCQAVVLTAGIGNGNLSGSSGKEVSMQKRPLHMVMARGPLPLFQGHCIDGAQTRLTITSEQISDSETVWQLGGQIAEQGVERTTEQQIACAIKELEATLPALDCEQIQFATYRVDRAERKSRFGLRPDTPQIVRHSNVLTCWPTKMAFAPRIAQKIAKELHKEFKLTTQDEDWKPEPLLDWETPEVAASPWDEVEEWYYSKDLPVTETTKKLAG